MANHATKIAEDQLGPIVDIARRDIENEQRDELERLEALAAVNPNIRAEEIEYRKSFAAELLAHIEHTQLKLDAVRVGLAT